MNQAIVFIEYDAGFLRPSFVYIFIFTQTPSTKRCTFIANAIKFKIEFIEKQIKKPNTKIETESSHKQ